MIITRLIAALLVLTATTVFADEASKTAKLKELMKLQGLYETIDQQKKYGEDQATGIGLRIYEDYRREWPATTEKEQALLEKAYRKYQNAAKPAWNTEEAVQAWVGQFGRQVTEAELDAILAFYKSAAGQKDLQASKKAMIEWGKFFAEKNNSTKDKAVKTFIEDLKVIESSPMAH